MQQDLIKSESRQCFRYDETIRMKIPFVVDKLLAAPKGYPEREVTRAELVDEFTALSEDLPTKLNAFLRMQRLFPRVCPMGLIWDEVGLADLVAMESKCSRYHVSPVNGALEDWPSYLSHAFDIITEARNEFEMWRMDNPETSAAGKKG